MPSADEDPADALPPHVQVIQMATGLSRSRALYAAAEPGLADHLAGGPGRAEEVADANRGAAALAPSTASPVSVVEAARA